MGLKSMILGQYSPRNPRLRMSKLDKEVFNARAYVIDELKEALKASRVTARAYRAGLETYVDLEEGGLIEAEATKDKNISPLDATGFAEEMFKGVPMNPTLKRGILGYMKGHPEVVEQVMSNLEGKLGGVVGSVLNPEAKKEIVKA